MGLCDDERGYFSTVQAPLEASSRELSILHNSWDEFERTSSHYHTMGNLASSKDGKMDTSL